MTPLEQNGRGESASLNLLEPFGVSVAGQRIRYSDWLRAGRSGDRIPVGARFSAPVQTDPGDNPASCTMSTGSFPGERAAEA